MRLCGRTNEGTKASDVLGSVDEKVILHLGNYFGGVELSSAIQDVCDCDIDVDLNGGMNT